MKGKYNPNIHSSLLAAVGAYLLYIAWILADKYRSGANEMPIFWNIAAIVFFALGGLGTLLYAWMIYSKSRKKQTKNGDEEEKK